MARSPDVQFKGTKGGLLVRFDEGEDFEKLKERLAERLDAAQKFFHGSAVTIDIGNRILTTKQLLELEALFASRYGVRVLQVVNGGLDQGSSLDELSSSDNSNQQSDRPSIVREMAKEGDEGYKHTPLNPLGTLMKNFSGDTLLIKRTVRSGQRISYNGNVVILGDVNPGAEVIATGDILVMGNLRGIVHAGAKGDNQASVVAFRLWPTQLRIGNIISRAPDGEHGQPGIPEIARVRDGEVVIDPFPGLGSLEEFLSQR